MENITLRKIYNCSLEQQKEVLEIRNKDNVKENMYTDHSISMHEHLSWIERLKSDDRQSVFVVFFDEVVSGVISVNGIDKLHSKADWAFYLDSRVRGGLGAALEFSLLNFVFDDMKLDKLNCEVIETNSTVVKMHKKFGFVEEGFRRENIEKNGVRMGVFFLGITRDEWLLIREDVLNKYKSVIGKFSIKFEV